GGGLERLGTPAALRLRRVVPARGALAVLGPGAPGVAPSGRAVALHGGVPPSRGRPGADRTVAVATAAPAVPGRGAGRAAGRGLAPFRAAGDPAPSGPVAGLGRARGAAGAPPRAVDVGRAPERGRAGGGRDLAPLVAGRARPARLGRALRRAPDADPADRPARVLPDA